MARKFEIVIDVKTDDPSDLLRGLESMIKGCVEDYQHFVTAKNGEIMMQAHNEGLDFTGNVDNGKSFGYFRFRVREEGPMPGEVQ